MTETTHDLIFVNADGDIVDREQYATEASALRMLREYPAEELRDAVATVESVRTRGDGSRLVRRAGVVRTAPGYAMTPAQTSWARVDATFYAAGDEPDAAVR